MTVRFCRDPQRQSGDLSRSYGFESRHWPRKGRCSLIGKAQKGDGFNSRGVENRILGSSRNGGSLPYSGPLAQLVERLPCKQEVAGSIPVRSTEVSLR